MRMLLRFRVLLVIMCGGNKSDCLCNVSVLAKFGDCLCNVTVLAKFGVVFRVRVGAEVVL
jgi:hypothetical protein